MLTRKTLIISNYTNLYIYIIYASPFEKMLIYFFKNFLFSKIKFKYLNNEYRYIIYIIYTHFYIKIKYYNTC